MGRKPIRARDLDGFAFGDRLGALLDVYGDSAMLDREAGALRITLAGYHILLQPGDGAAAGVLVTAFDFLRGGARNARPDPSAFWGRDYVRKRGHTGLFIVSRNYCWYQSPTLTKFLRKLRQDGFLAGFSRRIAYGGSMGGCGAIWRAAELQADAVLAMSPQVVMDEEMTRRGDIRFPAAREQDWDRSRLAAAVGPGCEVVVAYDPRYDVDAFQVEALRAQVPVREIHCPYVGHSTAGFLATTGCLSSLADDVIAGRMEAANLRRYGRARRGYGPYFANLEVMADRGGHAALARAVRRESRRQPLRGELRANKFYSIFHGRQAGRPLSDTGRDDRSSAGEPPSGPRGKRPPSPAAR